MPGHLAHCFSRFRPESPSSSIEPATRGAQVPHRWRMRDGQDRWARVGPPNLLFWACACDWGNQKTLCGNAQRSGDTEEAWDGDEEAAECKNLQLGMQSSTLLPAWCSKEPCVACYISVNNSTRCPETKQGKLDSGGCQNKNPALLPTNQNAMQAPLQLGFPPGEGGTQSWLHLKPNPG